jgi:hypothetical protein
MQNAGSAALKRRRHDPATEREPEHLPIRDHGPHVVDVISRQLSELPVVEKIDFLIVSPRDFRSANVRITYENSAGSELAQLRALIELDTPLARPCCAATLDLTNRMRDELAPEQAVRSILVEHDLALRIPIHERSSRPSACEKNGAFVRVDERAPELRPP